MTENRKNQISMQEALKYQDALSRQLRGTATTEDYLNIVKTEYRKAGIKLGVYKEPIGYPVNRNMI